MKLLLSILGLGIGLAIIEAMVNELLLYRGFYYKRLWWWITRKKDRPIVKLTDAEIRQQARKMLHRETGL